MTRRNPFEELEQLFDRMSRQVDPGDWGSFGHSVPADVADTEETITITIDLPGYDREDIDLTLGDGQLRITAERENEAVDEESEDLVRYVRKERSQESVNRTIRLPGEVDEDDAVATLEDGVLTVTLPKAEPDATGKHIDIE